MATPLRLTKSRSEGVPLHSIDSHSGLLRRSFDRTPKIWIVTDAADSSAIPVEIRNISGGSPRVIRGFAKWSKTRERSDAALVWCEGDRFLSGNLNRLLKSLHAENRRSFVVVNTPCVDEVPFLTIQPRVFAGAASIDYWNFRTRIENAGAPLTWVMVDSCRSGEPWSKLVKAISAEKAKSGAGVESLLCLWETRDKLPDVIAALVVRNLVAAMLLHREVANARKFLEAGIRLYPTYAELHYQGALLAIREHRSVDAIPLLERAKSCGAAVPGSGGENSYRCDWLLGVLAAQVGDDRAAFLHFLAGVRRDEVFEPSLTELLKLRVPRSLIESHQHVFTRVARRNPAFVSKIFDLLSTHGLTEAAHRAARTLQPDSVLHDSFENQLDHSTARIPSAVRSSEQKTPGTSQQTVGVVVEGPFFEHSSLARVNREIAQALLSLDEFEVRLETSTPAMQPPRLLSGGTTLIRAVHRRLYQTDLTIRHQWPPNFRSPPTGKLAVILPWEYGGVPRVWIEQIQQNVDELWVPSSFVHDVFVRNGVDARHVVVIPNGFDPRIFRPEGPSLRPQGSRGFIFLFVGGAIRRKGIDLLLAAYKSAFTADQDVSLILLVSGSSGAYQHNSLTAEIRAAATDPSYPHILPIFETIDDSVLSNLYRGADAFVLPYRGEGFGMPLLEAMACGKPVITTSEGPAKDFCSESNSYLLSARAEPVTEPPPLGPIVGSLTWFEPDLAELILTLRHVHENRREAVANGKAATISVSRFSWPNVTQQYAAHIRRLCQP